MSLTVDEQILASAKDPHALDMFQLGPDGEISVKQELDMMFTLNQFRDLNRPINKSLGKAALIKHPVTVWLYGVIYYEFVDSAYPYKDLLYEAMDQYNKYTCLSFAQSRRRYRIKIIADNGCWAHVGCSYGIQYLSMDSTCNSLESALHEIGHAAGLYHEHTRYDRDSYIAFNPPHHGEMDIHKKLATNRMETQDTRYDYKSVMHYGRDGAFRTLDPAYQNIIGRATKLSYNDIKGLNRRYYCQLNLAKCPKITCPFNGFILYKEFMNVPACRCWCDSGNTNDPIIPCANITQEVPGYNISPSSSKYELNQTVCMDIRTDCATLKAKRGCYTNLRTMYTQCTKTCNFCGKGENLCMDYEDGCHIMAGSGACKDEGLKEIMSKKCRKSCGLCEASTPCQIVKDIS